MPIVVDNNRATGSFSELMVYPFASSLVGLLAHPTDVRGCGLVWGGSSWSGKAGIFLTLESAMRMTKTNIAAGSIFQVGDLKYTWDGANLNAVSAVAGEYESGEREVYGPLATVLATTPPDGTWSEPTDLSGGRIQYRGGLWYGGLGTFASTAARDAAVSGLGAKLATGTRATVGASEYSWTGSAWVAAGETVNPATLLYANQSVTAAGGWGITGAGAGTTISVSSEVVRQSGRPVLCIDSSSVSADVYATVRRKVTSTDFSGPFEFWFWVDAPSAQIDMNINFSSDTPANDPPNTTPANRITFSSINSVLKPGAWNCLRVDPKNATIGIPGLTRTVTGSPDLANIKQIQFYIFFPSALAQAKRVAYVDTCAVGSRRRSKVFFTCDGDQKRAIEALDPLFSKYNIKRPAMFGDRNDAISDTLKARYNFLITQGWEVGCNGQNHTNYRDSPQLLDSECANAEAYYVAAGLPRPTLFGCPVGANSGEVDAILKARGYVGCRGQGITPYQFDPQSGYQSFNGVSIESGVTAATTLERIDAAIAAGASIALLFHDVVDTVTTPSLQVSTAIFEAILSGIATRRASGLIDDVTMGDFCRYGR